MYVHRTVVRKVKECRLLSLGVWCSVATQRYVVRDGIKWELLVEAVLQKLTLCYLFLAVCLFPKVCMLWSDGQTKCVLLAVILYIIYICVCVCVGGGVYFLLIKHAPLPWVILHAVGMQLGSITGDTVASITWCRQSLYSLYIFTALIIVWSVYVYSLLQLIEIYGFCKGEERL